MLSGLHFFTFFLLHRLVDPSGRGQLQLLRETMLPQPFGVLLQRFVRCGQPLVINLPSDPEMHVRRRVECGTVTKNSSAAKGSTVRLVWCGGGKRRPSISAGRAPVGARGPILVAAELLFDWFPGAGSDGAFRCMFLKTVEVESAQDRVGFAGDDFLRK